MRRACAHADAGAERITQTNTKELEESDKRGASCEHARLLLLLLRMPVPRLLNLHLRV